MPSYQRARKEILLWSGVTRANRSTSPQPDDDHDYYWIWWSWWWWWQWWNWGKTTGKWGLNDHHDSTSSYIMIIFVIIIMKSVTMRWWGPLQQEDREPPQWADLHGFPGDDDHCHDDHNHDDDHDDDDYDWFIYLHSDSDSKHTSRLEDRPDI